MHQSMLPIMGVDSHAHVFLKDLPWSEGRRYAPSYDASLDLYLTQLAEHGISHGVLIQPSFLGTDNRYLLECLERHPQQLRGVVVVDPQDGLSLLDAFDEKGVVGIRENLIGKDLPDFSNETWQDLLSGMRERGWHLEVQVEAERLEKISPAILQSGVRLVVDHFGRLDPEQGVQDPGLQHLVALGKTQQVWVKISGAYRISPRIAEGDMEIESKRQANRQAALKTAQVAYGMLKQTFGVQRMVWGSDWPHTTFERTETFGSALRLFDEIVTDPAERRAVLVTAPKALFRF